MHGTYITILRLNPYFRITQLAFYKNWTINIHKDVSLHEYVAI